MSEVHKHPDGPGASEAPQCDDSGVPRRSFVKWTVASLLGFIAAIFGWSSLSSVASRILGLSPERYSRVEGFASLPIGQPARLTFPFTRVDAYLQESGTEYVWVIKRSPTEAVVFSPICPHLGCRYGWQGAQGLFVCPCHNSVFDVTGKLLGGPAPRDLDTIPWKVENGALYVEWENFKTGVPVKVRT